MSSSDGSGGMKLGSMDAPPDPYDHGLLKDEAARIKRQLYAEYGAQIETMLSDAKAHKAANAAAGSSSSATDGPSQIDQWTTDVEELIKYQKPLREQIRKSQQEALDKLVTYAKEDASQRGVDVDAKLRTLLQLQNGGGK